MYRYVLFILLFGAFIGFAQGQSQSYSYLDSFCDPYYAGRDFPKLETPQWVGTAGVDAVITLGIDDMRDPRGYEAYLRPLLNRLKEIDGRAPVSIMTCQVDPEDPQLQSWLREGLSIEIHTIAHPCPLLQGGNFDQAKKTYDDCVDLMNRIPGNHPVAFRFPCMDSRNTPSPRAFAEILGQRTSEGNFLQASTSVTCLFTPQDPALPDRLTLNEDGSKRFRRYIPFPSFVNIVENYPYPFLIGGNLWEFPCMIPDDWQAQNIQRSNNPRTVVDMKAAIDATVIKKGMANIIFHPHGWIRAEQMAEVVDYVHKKYGDRVLFLTFKECMERINRHLLLGHPVRRVQDGGDGGVRILDANSDGYLDVLIGNPERQVLRIWDPDSKQWHDQGSPLQIVQKVGDQLKTNHVRFGTDSTGNLIGLQNAQAGGHLLRYAGNRLESQAVPASLRSLTTAQQGVDTGLRFRDLDNDGASELISAGNQKRGIYRYSDGTWRRQADFPVAVVSQQGLDGGVRWADLNQDGFDDLIKSTGAGAQVHLYDPETKGFGPSLAGVENVPPIAVDGRNYGAWIANGHLWIQNEHTNRLPDGVDRRRFGDLLGTSDPPPRSAEASLESIQVGPEFRVELVAAEPLVMDPVAIDWGPDGKLWVVEMADYPLGLDDQGEPGGRVRFLEDTDGDGRYDRSTVFLDKIPYPTGVLAYQKGVLVSAAPSVFYAEDTDGDGKADRRDDLFKGFGEGNQQHRVNGFQWGLDNWLYLANGDSHGVIRSSKTDQQLDIRGRDLRIRPDTGQMQAIAGQTQFGRHRDEHGNWFGCSNPLPLRHYVLDDQYQRRNPHYAAGSLVNDIARVDNTQLFPISRVLSHWSGYRPPAAGAGHRFTSACSVSFYRDNLLGEALRGNSFTCEPVHNAVHRRQLTPNGVTFNSARPKEESEREFLASSDSWFRPATVTTGPDGAIWVVDMYRLVIEHPEWIDDAREKELFLRAGHDRGRIYRVVPTNAQPRTFPQFAKLSIDDLVDRLANQNGPQRDLAQQQIIQRADEVTPTNLQRLKRIASEESAPWQQLHALCTLDGLGKIDSDVVKAAMDSEFAVVRRHAIRISEGLLDRPELARQLLPVLRRRADDEDPHVRLQLAYSLGESNEAAVGAILAKIAADAGPNRYFSDAVFSSINEKNLAAFFANISQNSEVAKRVAGPLLSIAGRMNDKTIVGHLLVELLDRIETSGFDADSLVALQTARRELSSVKSLPAPLAQQFIKLAESARRVVADRKRSSSDRVNRLNFLAEVPLNLVPSLGVGLADYVDAAEDVAVQVAAVSAIAKLGDARGIAPLLNRFSELSPSVRSALLAAMMKRTSWTPRLIEALEQKVVATSEIGVLYRQQLLENSNEKVAAAAKRLFVESHSSREIAALMKRYSEHNTDRDPVAGRAVFLKRCAACHRLDGAGHQVGPDLKSIKSPTPRTLLTAILDPNRAVEDKYRSYNILTVDGRSEVGVIQQETATAITLRQGEGKTQVFLRQDIDLMKSTGKSLMPEGIEKEITPKQMGDLLAYLGSLGPPPKQFEGNQPQTVTAEEDDGTLTLAATNCRIYGPSLVFESGYKNLGFWGNQADRAAWTINANAGRYDVWLDYACASDTSGNRFSFEVSGQQVLGKVDGTGTWDQYKSVRIGNVEIEPGGLTEASFQSDGALKGFLIDLRAIRLVPKADCCGR